MQALERVVSIFDEQCNLSKTFICSKDSSCMVSKFFFFLFLVGYVEERPWWPIQSPNKGRNCIRFDKSDSRGHHQREVHVSIAPDFDLSMNSMSRSPKAVVWKR